MTPGAGSGTLPQLPHLTPPFETLPLKTRALRTIDDLDDFVRQSLSYSALHPEIRDRWVAHAFNNWYAPLVREGYGAAPFGLILDIGVRVAQTGTVFRPVNPEVPDPTLYTQYVYVLDKGLRGAGVREWIGAAADQEAEGLLAYLRECLTPLMGRLTTTVVLSPFLLAAVASDSLLEPVAPTAHYRDPIESFLRLFIVQSGDMEATTLPYEKRLLIRGTAGLESSLSFLDLELIDRCLHMDDLPPLTGALTDAERRAATLRLELPVNRKNRPDGGYVGISNTGGLEDLSNPVLSEWAYPAPLIWEKLARRNLLVYERSSQSLSVRTMALHVTLPLHNEFLQVDPDAGTAPLLDVKHLVAAVIRDLTPYLCPIGSIDTHLIVRLAASPPGVRDVRTIRLSQYPLEIVRRRTHFLLEEPDLYPWLFSTDLTRGAPMAWHPGTASEPRIDLAEDWLAGRDYNFRTELSAYDARHCLFFCSEKALPDLASGVRMQVRGLLDLGPDGCDSLVFVVRLAIPETGTPACWRVVPLTGSLPKDSTAEALTARQARERIRQVFLSRLLGLRNISGTFAGSGGD